MPSPLPETVGLAPGVALKLLETPCAYHVGRDELYELSADAFDFLARCGPRPAAAAGADPAFLATCLAEGVLAPGASSAAVPLTGRQAPTPSLRYLELQVTDRCNLRCRHCYLGDGAGRDLPWDDLMGAVGEFEEMQGLRLLVSGGEPLLHPRFWDLNEVLPSFRVRSVLLTNGTLLDDAAVGRLRFHEVQVSLDGLREGHELLRGRGTFDAAVGAIRRLRRAGIDVAVATMAHRGNLGELEDLGRLVDDLGAREWNVDALCPAGRLLEHPDLPVSPEEAGRALRLARGGGHHGSSPGLACGANLCAVLPGGEVARCGLYAAEPVGRLAEGLRACWERLPRVRLADLTCDCPALDECRGGCRFRAGAGGDPAGPDLAQCHARGVLAERR